MGDREFGHPHTSDDDFTDVDLDNPVDLDAPPASDLDDLAAELEDDVDLDPSVTLEVPGRPNYAVEYRTDLALRQIDGWRRKSRVKGTGGAEVDIARFSTLVLANTCKGILRHGEPQELNGTRLTFATREFQDVVGVAAAGDAVRKMYRRDASIIAAAQAVLAAAGFDDVALAVDPT